MKLYQVTSVTVTKQSESPLTLIIHALGLASSTGWTNPVLDASGDPNPEDAILEFIFAAKAPTGITLPVISPVAATLVVTPGSGVDAVVVNARTNSLAVHASEFLTGHAGGARPGPLTTLVLGEEGATTLRIGEEGLTTMAMGEEHPGTWLQGENASTRRLGEEGPTTNPQLDDPADPASGGFGGPFGQF